MLTRLRSPLSFALLAALLCVLSLAARPAAAQAAYQVTNLLDDGNTGPAGSLRAAILAANATPGATITFQPGLSGTITLASGLPTLTVPMSIVGPGAGRVAVDGAGQYRPFNVTGGTTANPVVLSGLTIQNGNSAREGGGVYNSGTLTLTGCTLTGNRATYYGGAIFNNGGGTLTLTGCTLTGNQATYYGAGVYNNAGGTLTMTGCTLTQNSAEDGGGVYNYSGTLTMTGCALTGNQATYDGAGVNNVGTLTLTGCTLTGNRATDSGGAGGGIFNYATLTLTDDILYGDTQANGGEIYLFRSSVTATYCDIQGNGTSGTNIDVNPNFVNNTTAPYDLHLSNTNVSPSPLASGGGLATGATDHDGNPYASPNPSMGAFQYGVYTVTTLADTASPVPVGSLRAAITYATSGSNSAANGGMGTFINFFNGNSSGNVTPPAGTPILRPLLGVITLTGPLPTLNVPLRIATPPASLIAIDGAGKYQPFSVTGGTPASPVVLSGLTIQKGNAGSSNGGGVNNGGVLTLTGCTLTGNTAPNGFGGGVNNGGGTLTMTGCALTSNTANFGGGGVNNSGGTLTLTGCTLTQNSAPLGGGVFNSGGTATLTDDILYNDTEANGGEISGSFTTTYCDIQGGGFPDQNHNFGADPQFVSATAPYDLHLKAGSASRCIGAGTATAPAYSPTDNDGFPYATVPGPSIGAFEYHGPNYVVNTLAGNVAGNAPGDVTLRAAIISANSNGTTTGTAIPITFTGGLTGIIALTGPPTPLAVNVSITGPTTALGIAVDGNGVIRPFFISGGTTVAISNLTIQNGNSSNSDGGAVFNNGTLTLTGCTLTGNQATYYGGGVFNGGTLTLAGCTLTGNSAANSLGGGVFNNGTLTMTGCALTQNSAQFGGGVYNNGGMVTLTGCTLTGNTAQNGGGVYNTSTLMLTDDILYNDTGGEIAGNNAVTASYCDIQGADDNGNDPAAGTGNIDANPLLSPLGFYGGPTQTFALLPGSPCLAAGTTEAAATDQRGAGFPRSRTVAGNTTYDIGAFESQGFTLALTGNNQSAVVGQTFSLPLAVSVSPVHAGDPLAGGLVAFNAPATGASAALSPLTVTLTANGTASAQATANTFTGAYTVAADTRAGLANFRLTNIGPTITLPPTTLTPAQVNQPYTQALNPASGGTAPYTYAVTGGALPPGITLSTSGTLSGTTQSRGQFNFTVIATDSSGGANGSGPYTGSQSYTLTVIPPTFTVTSTSDDPTTPGTLRRAINSANIPANVGATIAFQPGLGAITLTSPLPPLTQSMTIQGMTGQGPQTVDGGHAVRCFAVTGGTVTLTGLTLQNGLAQTDYSLTSGLGGAVAVTNANLTLTACRLTGNSSSTFGGGGALFSDQNSTLTLINCLLTGNTACNGGALLSFGPLTLTECSLSGNSALAGGALECFGMATLTDDILYGDQGYGSGEIAGTANASACDIQGGYPGGFVGGGYAGKGGGGGAPNLNVDPLFVQGAGGGGKFAPFPSPLLDLHLQAGSPVIGQGISSAPGYSGVDIEGTGRPPLPSMGAFEGGAQNRFLLKRF